MWRVKDLGLLVQRLGSLLWFGFDLWSQDSPMQRAWPEKRRKKQKAMRTCKSTISFLVSRGSHQEYVEQTAGTPAPFSPALVKRSHLWTPSHNDLSSLGKEDLGA